MTEGIAAGIIAAGDGTRLAGSHPGLIKPLVPVAGRPLCHWVARALAAAGAREITLLHNSRGRAVAASLSAAFPKTRWTFLEADTASSWESFRLVCRALAERADDFILSAVDSLVAPAEAARFAAFRAGGARCALALTEFVDDEKPLWADLEGGLVRALGDDARARRHVTAGLYRISASLARAMPEAAAFDKLRLYWRSLLRAGEPVAGLSLSKTVDVDRPRDIREAERFLKQASASW